MQPWPAPAVPRIPGQGQPVHVYDSASGRTVRSGAPPVARMYVCGITPYDATHIGHAATYVTFDLLHRAWLDAGLEVHYVQNVTDVDDPLLQRARDTGEDWQHLALRETQRFADDMTALGVLPPAVYLGAVEGIPLVVDAVTRLLAADHAYRLPADGAGPEPGYDVYFDVSADPRFGEVSGYDRERMAALFEQRGGDLHRPGKRHPLDPLLWRAHREGEPGWESDLGPGRPGWHIECTTIALTHLGAGFDVQGGGADLVFPHHEMSAAHAHALGNMPFAQAFVHAGLVGLDGEKMSKSRGNLVFVSQLRAAGVEPAAIRLALLAHRYRFEWDWTQAGLDAANDRLAHWRDAVSREGGPDPAETLAAMRTALADDLDAPTALRAVDAWVERQVEAGGADPGAPGVIARAVDALLGVRL